MKINRSKSLFCRLLMNGLVLSVLAFVAGCAPRGETKSLDQIVADSKDKFSSLFQSVSSALDQDVANRITKIGSSLDWFLAHSSKGNELLGSSEPIVSTLEPLVLKAGYASRPALGEIVTQHRVLIDDLKNGEIVSEGRIKLLVARTYATITSELESTKFALTH